MNLSKFSAVLSFRKLWLGCCGLGALTLPDTSRAAEASDAGTLAYHLATNAAGYAAGRNGGYGDQLEIKAPNSHGLDRLTNAVWSPAFWLKGVHGLSATPIGFSSVLGAQGLPTMVSPRHYLCATHMHPEGYQIAFLDTNNVVHWRHTLQRVDVGNDVSTGILDADLPPAVGFLPVLPGNYTNRLPAFTYVQGIGMNQDLCLFGQPMIFGVVNFVNWNSHATVLPGLTKNWNVTIRGGDSSNPEMLLIGNQLVLVSHNYTVGGGPNYAAQLAAINQSMHRLSTNQQAGTDYQLTQFPLDRWPLVHGK
jgi:hypothetical protein